MLEHEYGASTQPIWFTAVTITASRRRLGRACQFNREQDGLERAKKRLFYSLYQLGLPMADGWQAGTQGLLFDFLDDARTQPETYPDTFITSGYAEGVITINVLEADDVARTAAQAELRERYRTLLGHFRHESGHYFWSLLSEDEKATSLFADLFGDANAEYRTSLDRYYKQGPPADWEAISGCGAPHGGLGRDDYLLMHDAPHQD